MARALSRVFGCREGDLPPNFALAAKLLTAALLSQSMPFIYTEPFLPFLSVFDVLRPYGVFRPAMIALCATGMVGMFLTRRTRSSCLMIGTSLLLTILASKEFYSNGKVFWSLMFLHLGLRGPRDGDWSLRWQFVVMYAGCSLSKGLDADWWSGRFFDNWMTARLHNPLYAFASPLLPEPWFARLLSWSVIAAEAAVAWLFAVRRDRPAVWLTIFLHGGILLMLGGATFGGFFYAVAMSLLVFVEWPDAPMTLTFDPRRAPHAALAGLLRRSDVEGSWRLRERAGARLEFETIRSALFYTPLLHFALFALLLPSASLRCVLVAGLAALYFPRRLA